MELLWPELAAEAAGANLRKAIHFARRAMGSDDAVQGESGMLSLWGGQVTVDAGQFTAAVDAALAAGDVALGEAHLLSGRHGVAAAQLRRAVGTNTVAPATASRCVSLERLAQTELALANDDQAHALLTSAYRSPATHR